MKQKVIIPATAYKVRSEQDDRFMPYSFYTPSIKAPCFIPLGENIFQKLCDNEELDLNLNFAVKQDPRRSKDIKSYEGIVFSFNKIFSDKTVKSDFTLNQDPNAYCCFSIVMNQFLGDYKKNYNSKFNFNGLLKELFIDRCCPFEVITIKNNNTTDWIQKDNHVYYSKTARIIINDNNIKKLNLIVDNTISKDSKQNFDIKYLVSNSLENIKIEAKKLSFTANINKYKLLNMKELNLFGVDVLDFKNNFLWKYILEDKANGKINPEMNIILNPLSKISTNLVKNQTDYDMNKPNDLISVKKFFKLNNNEPLQIKYKDLVKLVEKRYHKVKEEVEKQGYIEPYGR